MTSSLRIVHYGMKASVADWADGVSASCTMGPVAH